MPLLGLDLLVKKATRPLALAWLDKGVDGLQQDSWAVLGLTGSNLWDVPKVAPGLNWNGHKLQSLQWSGPGATFYSYSIESYNHDFRIVASSFLFCFYSCISTFRPFLFYSEFIIKLADFLLAHPPDPIFLLISLTLCYFINPRKLICWQLALSSVLLHTLWRTGYFACSIVFSLILLFISQICPILLFLLISSVIDETCFGFSGQKYPNFCFSFARLFWGVAFFWFSNKVKECIGWDLGKRFIRSGAICWSIIIWGMDFYQFKERIASHNFGFMSGQLLVGVGVGQLFELIDENGIIIEKSENPQKRKVKIGIKLGMPLGNTRGTGFEIGRRGVEMKHIIGVKLTGLI